MLPNMVIFFYESLLQSFENTNCILLVGWEFLLYYLKGFFYFTKNENWWTVKCWLEAKKKGFICICYFQNCAKIVFIQMLSIFSNDSRKRLLLVKVK